MYLLILFLFLPETVLSGPKCGGTFSAPRGILTTPNFPKKFPTPIHCKWIIDAHDAAPNSSIIVYLTQVYVFEGLTFKEYKVYLDGYALQGDEIYSVTEDTVNNVSFVRCHTNYLEITLNLSSLEGTHQRVLDGLLDVYGFNITYEITTRKSERENKCTMKKCGFTGFCYDHFTHFSCDCFPGYSGEKCSEGNKSKCFVDGHSICKNGGTCTHVGDSAVICECGPEFTGTHCDIPVSKLSQHKGGCVDCLISCPFDGTLENVCKCAQAEGTLSSVNDSVGFESTVFISNSSIDMNSSYHRERARKYILALLKSEYVNVENVQISKSHSQDNGMTFRFQAVKRDEKRIRSVINKWKHFGAIGNISLVEKEIFMTSVPSLFLKDVSVSRNDTIRINQDVILTCEARGSSRMFFRWFRNGVLLNASLDISGNKWTKLINSDKGFYVAVLMVEKASSLDEGEYTCQVEDYGIQQCRSKTVKLRHHPKVWLEPTSLTINKGKPFSIKCLSGDPRARKYIYNWAKDGSLLRKKTEVEKYEILYPGGSILQVTGLNKSATYTCVVQDESILSKMSIEVNVLDGVISPCPAEEHEGMFWPETASGKDFKHTCPKNFKNYASRSCIMLENGKPMWLSPDYSNCTALELSKPIYDFQNLLSGYMQTTPLEVLSHVYNYLNNRTLLRGEGNVVLNLIYEVSSYNNFSKVSSMEEITSMILVLLDEILDQVNSLNKEQQVLLLQEILQEQLMFLVASTEYEVYQKSLKNVAVAIDDYHVSIIAPYLESTIKFKKPITMIRVVYKNLDKFLTTKSIIRLTSDDRDIDYKIISDIVGVWISEPEMAGVVYSFPFGHPASFEGEEWNLRCALASFAGSNYAWDTNVCEGRRFNQTTKICECDRPGTMTLLLVKDLNMSPHVTTHPHDTIILVGCSTCLFISSSCAIILLLNWIYHRSSFAFLKLQCCVSVSGTMVLFVLAFCHDLPKNYFLYVVSFLQCFFFMGMSSQLSTLLIIYSELVEIQSKDSIQLTVVGIITGAPLLVVFGNHLAHLTMDIHLSYWWLLKGTLSFNVFTICTSIMLLLFLLLFFLILKMTQNDKPLGVRFINNRSKLMKKTSLIFCSMILLAAISVVYVNIIENEIWHYAFSITSVLMGLIILSCLVFNSQVLMRKHFMEKLKIKQAKFGENSASPQKSDQGNEDMNNAIDLHTVTPSSIKRSMDFPPSIDRFNASSTQFNAISKSNSLNSPDILGTKVFVQLDLVASSLQSASKTPISPMDPNRRSVSYENKISVAITKAFDEPLKIASESKFCDSKSADCEHLDAVMDSISHDLNYLLNGHVEFKEQHGTSQTIGI